MPRIRFTSTPKLPRDLAHLGYILGTEAVVPDDEAEKWCNRGVAEIVPDEMPPAPPAEAPGSVVIPDDWEAQHHMARISLARRLTNDPVDSASVADAVITAEFERRAQPD